MRILAGDISAFLAAGKLAPHTNSITIISIARGMEDELQSGCRWRTPVVLPAECTFTFMVTESI